MMTVKMIVLVTVTVTVAMLLLVIPYYGLAPARQRFAFACGRALACGSFNKRGMQRCTVKWRQRGKTGHFLYTAAQTNTTYRPPKQH